MKKIIYTLICSIIGLSIQNNLYAQSDETRSVSGFKAISSAGPFNVHIKVNGTESLKINADKAILGEIETFVEDHDLKIKFKKHHNYHYDGRIEVYITAKSIAELSNAGSGNLNVDEGELNANKTSISIAGSGDVTTSLKADQLNVSIAGSGSAHLKGSSNKLSVSIAGSGQMIGKELNTRTSNVSIAGSGNAYLIASDKIDANLIGSGSVYYTGNASVSSNSIGSGKVRKSN
jgi:hypothetical protein